MLFIDEAEIFIKSGNGGSGCVSFETVKNINRGPPNGGNGGNGGKIVFFADSNIHTLYNFQKNRHFRAENGDNGQTDNKTGKSGKDLHIKLPVGTQIFDAQTDIMICDLSTNHQKFLFAHGGKRGLGNGAFKSSTSKNFRKYTEGQVTDEIKLKLKLKILSDVAIIGLPNAGKSSLISKITAKKPIVANYPFTTINPQFGVVNIQNYNFTVSDIPGIIKDASLGKGLGHKFLKHIERCKVLLHLVDISSDHFLDNYYIVQKELSLYFGCIEEKKEIICLNKIDRLSKRNILLKKNMIQQKTGKEVFVLSIYHNYGINHLVKKLSYRIKSLN